MDIQVLVGKTVRSIVGTEQYSEKIIFDCGEHGLFEMLHMQDCCENVRLEDVTGDVEDLIDTPIIEASERSNSTDPAAPGSDESWTWTFYVLATKNGTVTLRWFGSSNGWYGEEVTFRRAS